MKKVLAAVLLFCPVLTFAQYNFAVGLRAGTTSGITLKKMSPAEKSLEGILGFCGDCFSLTGLFEKQPHIADVQGLSWYYGGGFHIAFYRGNASNNRWFYNRYDADEAAVGFGIDGIVGIEYKIPEVPLAFSVDFKPFFELTTRNDFWFWFDPGFGIKLAF